MADPADLGATLARLHPDCWGWALACCRRDPDEAAEVLQTAYLRILEGRARFGALSTFRTWTFGVIRMVARERRLRALRQARRELATRHALDRAMDANESDGADDDVVELREGLSRLSSRQREVIELVFYHGLTIERAAQVMAVRVGTARTHYERAKQRLRALLRRPAGAPR